MARHVATTKQTSGAGFGFEDKVSAHYAVWLLQGGFPFMPRSGRVIKLEFQKRVDKHFLDDFVLTLEDARGNRQCAFSVKSDIQFGKTSASPELKVINRFTARTIKNEKTSQKNSCR